MASCCKYEFQIKQFGFYDCDPVRFYQTAWSNNRWIFWSIKLILLAYWSGWFIAGFIVSSNIERWWIFLTNWGVTVLLIYFLASFAVATYGVVIGTPSVDTKRSDVNLRTVSGSITAEERNESQTSRPELRWFHNFVWIFHETAFAIALFITVAYWALLDANTSPISINVHAINLVIMVVDLFLCDIPFRILHFFHVSLVGVAYTVFSLILHGAQYTSAIYPILNWVERVGFAVGLSLITIFIALPIVHLIGFGLYHLRSFIARQCVSKDTFTPASDEYEKKGEENEAFSA